MRFQPPPVCQDSLNALPAKDSKHRKDRNDTKDRKRSVASGRATGKLRIIGGKWRSRRIAFPESPGLRPTPDRIRETLFNWLGQRLDGYHCLDLFAGSGALGLEALSRGAARVTLVEGNAMVARMLARSVAELGAADAKIVVSDALEFLRKPGQQIPYDLVFVDPPFAGGLHEPVMQLIPAVLAPGGLVYLECPAAQAALPGWVVEKEGRAGQVHFYLMRREAA